MKTIEKIFIAVFITLVTTLKLNEARCYDPNHMEVCNDDYTKCLCKNCPSCPPGFGLNYECGGRIKASQKLKCVRCVLGTTYSDTNSSAVCLPCPQCHGHVMMRPCTRVSPTECDPKVCEEGFVWNDVVEICERGQKIVTTPPATTTKPPTTTPVTTTPTPTSPTKPETSKAVTQKSLASIILSTIATASTTNKQPNDEAAHFHPTSSMNDQEHKKKIDIILVILVVIGAVLILASVLTGIVFCRKHNHCQICNIGVEDGKKEEEIPLNEIQDSPQVKHNDAMSKPDQVLLEETWPSEYLLKSVPCPLREQIEIAISNVNPPVLFGWRHIGEELELDSQTLDGIEIFECQLRGAQLLKVLKAEKPRITVTLFVKALIKCRRNDIVDKIKEFFHSK